MLPRQLSLGFQRYFKKNPENISHTFFFFLNALFLSINLDFALPEHGRLGARRQSLQEKSWFLGEVSGLSLQPARAAAS